MKEKVSMDVAASSSLGAPRWWAGCSRRWLGYFIAALGAGLSPAQEQVLLDYCWIYPESEAQSEQREYGKGYNSLLRTEATELSRMLQREGMEPKRAYEEAWLAVYRRHWLNDDWQPGSSELDEMLFQMMHTDSRHPMTDAEVRHALEVLFAEADFVSLEQGRELLKNLADNLRTHTFPLSESGQKSNDELMELFVDALQHNHDSMAAYRDALFKKNSHRLIHHPLVGYRAPWGTGLSARWRYAQAPQQTGITEGTANSSVTSPTVTLTVPLQTPGGATPVLDFTAGMNTTAGNLANFLATAPAGVVEKEDNENEEERKEEETLAETVTVIPAVSTPEPPVMMRSFRAMAAPVALTAAAAAPAGASTLEVNDKAVLYITSDGFTASGKTKVNKKLNDWKATYEVTNPGSYHDSTIERQTEGSKGWWKGDGNDLSWGLFREGEKTDDSSNNALTGAYNIVRLDGKDLLHIGGSAYKGTIEVTAADGAAATACPVIGSYDDSAALYQPGNLTGSGAVLLRGYNSTGTTIFHFNGSDKENWFQGTVYMSANGGTVQLNITDDRWQNTVFDLTSSASYSKSLTGGTGSAPAGIILNAEGAAQVTGIKGGTSGVSVLAGDGVLTFGCEGTDYTYAGDAISTTLELMKRGSNNQTITGTINVGTLGIFGGTLTTTGNVSAHAKLRGGVTWCMDGNKADGVVSYGLVDLYGRPVTMTSTVESTWKGVTSLDLSDSGLTSYNTALFDITGGLTLNLSESKSLFITGVGGDWKSGDRIALYSGNLQQGAFDSQAVNLTLNSVNYHATWEQEGNILYVQLGSFREGAQKPLGSADSYIWTGEVNGTIISDTNRDTYGLKMGSVWRADGSPENSGWGEQYVEGVSVGVYVNGHAVVFRDTDFYGAAESQRDVWVQGTVAPGSEIRINANNAVTSNNLTYGYAFTGAGTIADFGDKITSIRNSGNSVLVLNTANTFSGGVIMDAGNLYIGCDKAAGTGTIFLHPESELIVNYDSKATNYRTPLVENHIQLGGNASVSYGAASYAEDKQPCEWRHLQLTGGISGTGTLTLMGYTSSNNSTTNYVSSFIINETTSSPAHGKFAGVVEMKNAYNTLTVSGNSMAILSGAVQLSLQDSVFSDAVINMTRELSTTKNVGVNYDILGIWDLGGKVDKAHTSDNILVVEDEVSVKGLESAFLGKSWRHSRSLLLTITPLDSVNPSSERWRTRVVTPSTATLTLLGDDDENTSYVFSGAMGFEQSYAAPGQAFINEYNAASTDASFTAGGGTLGQNQLSLMKLGASKQYIHSADLLNLSLFQGTLGFNNLNLRGNLVLVGGSHLVLGETGQVGWNGGGTAFSDVSIAGGKTLLVYTPQEGAGAAFPQTTITGNVDMTADSALAFYVSRSAPSTVASESLLKVNGGLTLNSATAITVGFSSVEFALQADVGTPYYLAEATSGLSASGTGFSIDDLNGKLISLGYGYYGILGVTNTASTDYLTIRISGDPRCTWSGNVDAVSAAANERKVYEWYDTSYEQNAQGDYVRTMKNDYRWKEQLLYQNAQVVLFGNLRKPVSSEPLYDASADVYYYTSTQTTKVSGAPLSGTLVNEVDTADAAQYSFAIDGKAVRAEEAYQAVLVNDTVRPLSVVINSEYKFGDELQGDGTNYYFFGEGGIADAEAYELGVHGFDSNWKTDLRKMGTGTAVMALANQYSGGTILEGGRLVMQHRQALGTGGVTIQEGAVLQGDFVDDRSSGNWSSAYTGEGMKTTTVTNAVTAKVFVDPGNPDYTHEIDAYITNSYDKKLILEKLSGASDTVVALYGNSLGEGNDKYTYSVFKVLDPGDFSGTIVMDGNLANHDIYANLWDDDPSNDLPGGNVQMEIMSTFKATSGGNWLNATVDLSVQYGTSRTVLAFDAIKNDSSVSQIVQLDSLNGTGANSAVLSMSHEHAITLEMEGKRNGHYEGVLGFGDFQKTVDYTDPNASDIGEVRHHFGGRGKLGELSVNKLGGASQTVHAAWLNALHLGQDSVVSGSGGSYVERAAIGGSFAVSSTLVVSDIKVVSGSHLYVGSSHSASVHALTVGSGAILAIENDRAQDAFENIRPGIPTHVAEVPVAGSSDGETTQVAVAPSSFVLFENGATITAGSDWYTYGPSNREKVTLYNSDSDDDVGEDVFMEYSVDIDIADGAAVTFNSHHYTPDSTINSNIGNDLYGDYASSHVMQLLGKMHGKNVNLLFNNVQISAGARLDRTYGSAGSETGYVAIRDIHQFTGNINVADMTVLQVTESNDSANAITADMEVNVSGTGAMLQLVDGVKVQYMNYLTLENGGSMLVGGALKNAMDDGVNHADGVELEMCMRTIDSAATANNLTVINEAGAVSMGGSLSNRSVVYNANISTSGTSKSLSMQNAILVNSLVNLHAYCSLDLTDTVLVMADCAVQGAQVDMALANANNGTLPTPAVAANTVTTSSDTTVLLTFANNQQVCKVGNSQVLLLQAEQFLGVNVTGDGLTLRLTEDSETFLNWGYNRGLKYVAVQVGGGIGQFQYEDAFESATSVGSGFILRDSKNNVLSEYWVTSTSVGTDLGTSVSPHLLYFEVPEPSTTTLSLLALSALCARRRRK